MFVAAAPPPVEVVRCADQSFGHFRDAYDTVDSTVVGPLSLAGTRRASEALTAEDLDSFGGGTKFGILLRPGHRAVIRVRQPDTARITHAYRNRAFAAMPKVLRLRSCDRKRSGSRADGKPVSFWPGWVELPGGPACVPVSVRIDGGERRLRTLHIGAADCEA